MSVIEHTYFRVGGMKTTRPTSATNDLKKQFQFSELLGFLDMDENHEHGPALDEEAEINLGWDTCGSFTPQARTLSRRHQVLGYSH